MFKSAITLVAVLAFASAAVAQQSSYQNSQQRMHSTPQHAPLHHRHTHREYNGDQQYPNGQWKEGYRPNYYVAPPVVYPAPQPTYIVPVQPVYQAQPVCRAVPYWDNFKRQWVC